MQQMNLHERIELLVKLGEYMRSGDPAWQEAKEKAGQENPWFIPEFIDKACYSIAENFLQKDILDNWTTVYKVPAVKESPGKIGIVMAGNIPLVGFHDWLTSFITGHFSYIKPSSRDNVLLPHLIDKLKSWSGETGRMIQFSSMLKGCDAYIATGSNNTSRYFEFYFSKYPHIIRRNRTSVAILTGEETAGELEKLADDVYVYFGMGCRNVTKIYVPESYDFLLLLDTFRKYNYLADHHRYKNNFDYNLAVHILNKKFYMTNDSLLLVEDPSLFSPISQLNYEFYTDREQVMKELIHHPALQGITGKGFIPFGAAQSPIINQYADGIDTMEFLNNFTTVKNYEGLSK